MCVNESTYYAAKKERDDAFDEIERCKEGIDYFNGWTGKISNCISCLDQMISQTNAIAEQCASIIINGAPIDEGKRHYPNGGAAKQASNLESAKSLLESIQSSVDTSITDLTASRDRSRIIYDRAQNTMYAYPLNCGKCSECHAVGIYSSGCGSTKYTTTSTTTTTTSGCGSARTVAVSGGGSSKTTSTTRTGTTRSGGGGRATYNRAVMVAIE